MPSSTTASSEREALLQVQGMLRDGASVETVQSFLAQMLGPVPPPAHTKRGTGAFRASNGADSLTARVSKPGSPTSPDADTNPLDKAKQGFALPSVIPGGSTSSTTQAAGGGLMLKGSPAAAGALNSGAGSNNSAPMPDFFPDSTTSPPRGLPPTSNISAPLSVTGSTSMPNIRPVGMATTTSLSPSDTPKLAASVVRPEARREINAFIDSSYTRVPMPRRNMNASTNSPASGASPVISAAHSMMAKPKPLSLVDGRLPAPSSVPHATPLAPPTDSTSPKNRRETMTCVPHLSTLEAITGVTQAEDSSPYSRSDSSSCLAPGASGRSAHVVSLPDGVVAETPTFRAGRQGFGGRASSGHGRRASVADSLAGGNDSQLDAFMMADSKDSTDSCLPLASPMSRSGQRMRSVGAGLARSITGHPSLMGNVRRRNSVLPVATPHDDSASGIGGDEDEEHSTPGNTLLADWDGDANKLPGPRFARVSARETPAHVPLEETQRLLARIGVPFLPELHAEAPPPATTPLHKLNQTGDAAMLVDPVDIADRYGLESFVHIAMNCFLRYSFVQRFGFSVKRLHNFVQEAFSFFRPGNPLHHPIHASDILIAAHQWLCQPSVAASLTDEELLAFLFSAMVMRVGHSGVDNRLLTQMKHPYAMMCSYGSPQQGATVALVMALLEKPQCRFFPRIFHTQAVADSLTASLTAGAQDAFTAAAAVAAAPAEKVKRSSPSSQDHEWTQFREYQFFDIVSELVMATDERNHFVFHNDMVELRNDHFRSHGCLCPVRVGENGESQEERYATLVCRTCCCYICDTHLPKVLKAVLHFIDYAYLFRPYEVFLVANVVGTAENYRQQECQMRLLATTERLQRAAMAREANLAAAAMSSTDASPQSSVTSGPTALTANVAALRADVDPANGAAVASTTAVASEGADTGLDAEAVAGRVEAALLSEQPTWRTDALHSSTLSSLRMLQSMPERTAARMLQPAGERRPRPLADPSEEKNPDSPQNPSFSGSLSLIGTSPHQRPLQGHGRDIVLVALEELYFPFLSELGPYLPEDWSVQGRRNYERFIAEMPTPEQFEAVVEKVLYITAPDAPPAQPSTLPAEEATTTTAASLAHADQAMPPAATGGLPPQPSVEELRATNPLARYLPFELLARLVPALPRWHFDENGLETRILAEITQAGQLWIAFGARSKAIRQGKQAAASQGSAATPLAAAAGERRASSKSSVAPPQAAVAAATPTTKASH